MDIAARLEFVVAYLSNIVSVRVKDDLLQGISLEERRRQTFDGVKAMLVGESLQKPVVVILEDIHWVDQTSEEFLLYLSSSVAQNRILILALHRPFYQCPWATSSSHLRIPVPPLSHEESEELITEKNLFPELEYMFKHALTQDVAYNSLLIRRRREIHARIAAAIEALKRDSLEEHLEVLAYHYKNGDRPEKAFEYLARAGDKAVELCSPDLAKDYFTEALAIAPGLSPLEFVQTRSQELRSRLAEIAN